MGSSPASSSVSAAPTMSGPGFPPRHAGGSGILDDGRRTARLEDVRAVHCRRPKRPHIADTVPKPYRTWAQSQADAALVNVLAALPVVPWISNPHADRLAAHKPQQLVAATRCGRSCGAVQPDR
ncbi:hypothetical protein OHO83_45220 [Streptomyces sp. NBC_00569]|uniref:hypothetical protein n=1 Tax=unclassified Streptomyces TaxID=2593676 RepID=UPI002251F87C|nr:MULTISPECIES: hypothetical protein [unclassified Streptomyces]MCX5443540.1 hypothetical protein [Streptomyces sp. NBC_00063]WUB98933.1 hypothetical protein OHO83_45220 [Streptomyces sp. NBC_00569]